MNEQTNQKDIETNVNENTENVKQPTQEEIEEFFKQVDETSANIIKLFEGKDIAFALETISKVVSMIGDITNNNKIHLLEAIAKVVQQRYPDQHPLIKIVTFETGLLAGIDFKDDKLYIGENVDEDKLEENEITEIDLKTYSVVKNDYNIEDEKINKIIDAYKSNYSAFKEEFMAAQKRAKEQMEEASKVAKELDDVVEDIGVEEHV